MFIRLLSLVMPNLKRLFNDNFKLVTAYFVRRNLKIERNILSCHRKQSRLPAKLALTKLNGKMFKNNNFRKKFRQ